MVSTRGHKYKFTDGERVLCYEPDPTKAKVLYDSKVLEVIVNKDERGRKNIEYLIHFQGWNSSWDRCVSEDYVLKDTEENRKLQRDLAEKAQLQLGAYLYRKERKKRYQKLSDKINETLECGQRRRAVSTNSCSSMKSQDLEDEDDDDSLTTTDDESSVDTDDSLDEKVPIDLSSHMKSLLENDFDLVTQQNKLIKLPAQPNVLQILEEYIKHRAVISLQFRDSEPPQRRRSRKHIQNRVKDFNSVCCHLDLCKEIVDGLRIYFDFTVGHLLLYNQERDQFEETRSGKEYEVIKQEFELFQEKMEILSEDNDSQNVSQSGCTTSSIDICQEISNDVCIKKELEHETERRRSLRSHRDAPATSGTQNDGQQNTTAACSVLQPPHTGSNGISKLTIRNLGTLGHVSTVSGTSNHQSAMSCSSNSSYYSPMGIKVCAPPINNVTNSKVDRVMNLVNEWKIVPDYYVQQKPTPPSVLYGATHLARLFVKLPMLLYAANQPEKENQPRILPEKKMKALLHHLHLFLAFLDTHPEWFGSKHYINNPLCVIKTESNP